MYFTILPNLSLYIHIPWCIKKCPYCDFNSHAVKNNTIPEEQYVAALITDMEQSSHLVWGRTINTIFIGGGTPSLFSGHAINQILTAVRTLYHLSPYAEITMEINPGTLDCKHLAKYQDAGVNRFSFGVQSFNDRHLTTLGRVHNSVEAIHAITQAKQYCNNINLDIMYGLPNQSITQALDDIHQAINLQVQHISLYNLMIEPNTEFYKHIPKNLPDNDLCYEMQKNLIDTLAINHYKRYETSAFTLNNSIKTHGKINQFQAKHNLNYWLFGDYLGIGAGAHSKISLQDKIIRQVRQKQPQKYIDSLIHIGENFNQGLMSSNRQLFYPHIMDEIILSDNDVVADFAINAFRLIDGFDLSIFTKHSGLSLNMLLTKINQAVTLGFLTYDHNNSNRIIPTVKGQDFLNNLLLLFL